MFATLRCNQNSVSVERSGPTNLRLACKNCRSKKLKCSGEQTGCQRCVARGVDCEYTEALYKKGARQGRTASVSKSNANVSIRRTEQDFLSPTPIPTPSEGDNTYDASSNDFSRSLLTNSTKSHSNQQVSYCQDDSNGTDVFELPNDLLDGLSDPRVGATFLSSSDRTPELDGIWQSTSDSTLCNYALIDDDYLGSYLDGTRTGTASLSDADFRDALGFPRSSSPVLPLIPSNVHNDGLIEPLNTNISEYPSMSGMEGPALAESTDAGSEAHGGYPQAQPIVPDVPEPSRLFSPPNKPIASCQCILAALDLLEKLQTDDHRSSSDPLNRTLKLSKYALIQCSELATCGNCMNTSRFTMLLINLCQIVVASLDKALSGFEPRVNTEHENDKETSLTATIDTPEDSRTKDPTIFLKSYDIDDLEQLYVFATLVRLQISKWKTILARLKSAFLHLGLETQSAILSWSRRA
uniref:Zn(2)-C6 fungal-type domain-containing protein n=1 Tax=Cladonia uncialis subsp. uncialis TaxID=180999 RepID=A0A2K9YDR7_CLAUC|nr:hypothetical protein [Cladonia uncialis subsp. uncialis]